MMMMTSKTIDYLNIITAILQQNLFYGNAIIELIDISIIIYTGTRLLILVYLYLIHVIYLE